MRSFDMHIRKLAGPRTRLLAVPALAAAVLLWSPTALGQDIMRNGSLTLQDPVNSKLPMYWITNKWGSASTAGFVWLNSGGNRTIHVEVYSGSGTLPCASGDAKWMTKPLPVYPGGGKYTLSNRYRSTVPSALMVKANLSSGGQVYINAASLSSSGGAWKTANKTINIPVATTTVEVMHKICATGWVETDDYKLYKGLGPNPPVDAGVTPDTGGLPPLWDANVPKVTDAGTVVPAGGVISVAFDDGWLTVHKNALPEMKKQGIRATHFIHSTFVDKKGFTADFMGSKQLKELHTAGHEIGSHALNHDDWAVKDQYLTASTLDKHLKDSLATLKGFGFNVVGFAPPGGEGIDNITVQKAVLSYYKYQRSIKWGLNQYPYNVSALKSHIVINTTTLTSLKSWVDQAKNQNAWLILLYHRVDTPANVETKVTPLQFIDHMGVLKASGMPVKPIGEVLGIWKPYSSSSADGGSATVDSGGTTPVVDLGGNPWGDATTPFPGPDAGFAGFDAATRDQGIYSMPRPRTVDDDGLCSMGGGAASLPAMALVLLLGMVLMRRRRR